MSVELDTVLIGAGSATVAALGFVAAQRANSSMKKVENRKIDAEAYARAQDIYDHAIDQLEERNHDLEERLSKTVAALENLQREVASARAAKGDLATEREAWERRLNSLEREVETARKAAASVEEASETARDAARRTATRVARKKPDE